jgi:hypothetical protein
MMKSLAPLLAIVVATSSIGLIPFDDSSTANAASMAALEDPAAFAAAVANGPASWISILFSLFTMELPPWLESTISSTIDALALLVMIRMTKVIGTDRDCIIAKKIQEVADEFPVSVCFHSLPSFLLKCSFVLSSCMTVMQFRITFPSMTLSHEVGELLSFTFYHDP